MALSKQEIIRQIQQGKVNFALDAMVQVSGVARDKELQQRCVLLQSQLSQLNNKFGMGTIDNKTYQLELNRITQAALDMAYELPSMTQAPPQYNQGQYHSGSHSSGPAPGSAWKTWGILMTGGVGVLVIIIIIGSMMNNGAQPGAGLPLQPSGGNPSTTTNYVVPTDNPGTGNVVSTKTPSEPQKAPNPHDRYVGSWEGAMNIGGVSLAGLTIVLNSNNRYVSYMRNPADGTMLGSDQGTWIVTEGGLLVLNAQGGAKEVYNTSWNSARQFNATLVDGSSPEFVGMVVAFAKND